MNFAKYEERRSSSYYHLTLVRCLCVELTLWDEDLNEDDQIGDPVCLPLKNLQLNKPEHKTLKFGEVSHWHVTALTKHL